MEFVKKNHLLKSTFFTNLKIWVNKNLPSHGGNIKIQKLKTQTRHIIVQMFHSILDQFNSRLIMAHYTSPMLLTYFPYALCNSVTYNKYIFPRHLPT